MRLKLTASLSLVAISALLVVIQLRSIGIVSAQSGGWHPVKVHRDVNGDAHFFDVWDGARYVPQVLVGYGNIDEFGTDPLDDIGRAGGPLDQKLQDLAANKANFVRMWLRPSDGKYAYNYSDQSNPDPEKRGKVNLSAFRESFFARLDTILSLAESRGIVVEVMMWDTSTRWGRGPLPAPTDWGTCWRRDPCEPPACPNVHSPENHYQSIDDTSPVPGLPLHNCNKISFPEWFNTGNGVWMNVQLEYMRRVMQTARNHNNVTVEIINEDTQGVPAWRKFMHEQLRAENPEIVIQSEAIGTSVSGIPGNQQPVDNAGDEEMRRWGSNEGFGKVDMVSTHGVWSYDRAEQEYTAFPKVLPGCNESDFRYGSVTDFAGRLNIVRQRVWGLTFGGGASYIEYIGGASDDSVAATKTVAREMFGFFNPATDRPAFWEMKPRRDLISHGTAQHRYILSKDDDSEILVFVSSEAGSSAFQVNGSGAYQYRWFRADGANSFWTSWQTGSSWQFTPADVNYGLQIRTSVGGGGTPTAPSGLVAEANVGLPSDVILSWTNSIGETGFRIERRLGTAGSWQAIHSVPANTVTDIDHTASAAPPSTTYSYRVVAFNGVGESAPSNETSITMYTERPTAMPVINSPTGCISTVRPTFSWNAVPRASKYSLQVGVSADFSSNPPFINVGTVLGTSLVSPVDLQAGNQYYWRVRALNNVGAGPWPGGIGFAPMCGATAGISSPLNGATVTGTVSVTAETSPNVNRVEFYVDGILQSTDTVAPYEFSWNTAVNPVPLPNHSMDYGYFFPEWKDPATFDAYRAEVNAYTNLYIANLSSYNSDISTSAKMALLTESLSDAVREYKRIHLDLDQGLVDPMLDTAAPFWSNVVSLEVAHESGMSRAALESLIANYKSKLASRGLPIPSLGFGASFVGEESLPDSKNAVGLDWINIEGYLEGPGSAASQVNIDNLSARVGQRMSEVPSGKKIILTMQGYDRNGAWTNIDTLRDLQIATYLLVRNDPRVISLYVFSYARQDPNVPPTYGGTRFHPELKTPHRLIGEKTLGSSLPNAVLGPRTLSIRAVATNGVILSDRITVTVVPSSNPGIASVGVYRNGIWFLRNTNSSGPHDVTFGFGMSTDVPVVGDWDGDGVATVGVFRDGSWLLRNTNSTGNPDLTMALGGPGDIPVVGDWNGDGIDTVGVYRNGIWYLRNSNTTGAPDVIIGFGAPGDIPVVGDWNGDGVDTIGVFRQGGWLLRNSNTSGNPDLGMALGTAGDIPVVGDWNGDGVDTVGVFRQGIWFLRNSNTTGNPDITLGFGATTDKPVVGDWDRR